MHERARQVLRRVRAWPPANRPLTTALRWLAAGRPPEFLVTHLPRVGEVEVGVPTGGTARFWSAGDDFITSRVWWRGLTGFEPESVIPFLSVARHAGTIADVGAYTGYYAILAAVVNPSARVFAFEPHPAVAARLGRNVSLNPDVTVTSLPFAVSDHRGPAHFHVGGSHLPSSSSLDAQWEGLWETITVSTIDLAGFAADWGVDRLDLLKIDVENHEAEVIAGLGALMMHRPVIFFEVLTDETAARLEELLSDAGYRYFHLIDCGVREVRHLVPHPRFRNYMAAFDDRLLADLDSIS